LVGRIFPFGIVCQKLLPFLQILGDIAPFAIRLVHFAGVGELFLPAGSDIATTVKVCQLQLYKVSRWGVTAKVSRSCKGGRRFAMMKALKEAVPFDGRFGSVHAFSLIYPLHIRVFLCTDDAVDDSSLV
jgi:hypothetical protein